MAFLLPRKIAVHWDVKQKQEAESKLSLILLDINSLSVARPAKIWSMAGLDATKVKKVCIVNWMTLGVYRTRNFYVKAHLNFYSSLRVYDANMVLGTRKIIPNYKHFLKGYLDAFYKIIRL